MTHIDDIKDDVAVLKKNVEDLYEKHRGNEKTIAEVKVKTDHCMACVKE